jgi:ADP-ribose pyrophosphatase YjhB (NUDIX family)
VGCSAAVFDATGTRLLLIQRTDNGRWAVPGGYMESGEDFAEACAREVWEETGLRVTMTRLIGVYTTPHRLLTYPDGNRWQLVVLHFEAQYVSGEPTTSDESTRVIWASAEEAAALDLGSLDHERVADSFARRPEAAIHNAF